VWKTTDGGQTWQQLLDQGAFDQDLGLTMPAFASPTQGLGATSVVTFTRSTKLPAPRIVQSTLESTANGGVSWSSLSAPVVSRGMKLYEQPAFFGQRGVLPIVVKPQKGAKDAGARLDFDVSDDGGANWIPRSTLETTAMVKIGPYGATAPFLRSPVIAIATDQDWWVLSPAPSGRLTIYRSPDAGRRWIIEGAKGLPVVPLGADEFGGVLNPDSLHGISGTIAVADVYTNPAGSPQVYLTLDGGSRWTQMGRLLADVPNAPQP